MKAILVIDEMPKRCGDCICYQCGFCITNFGVVKMDDKPADCPLKPLPNAVTERGKWISEEYQKGWNAYRENLEK